MGSSSKKHKEKERDHKKKKKHSRSSRSRSRSKERKYRSRSRSRSPRERRRKVSPSALKEVKQERDVKPRIKSEKLDNKDDRTTTVASALAEGQGAGDNLSVEQANALRLKLGLKPLEMKKETDKDKESLKDDVHKPALNLSEVQKTEKLKEKMALAKQKRLVNQKLEKVKGLADSDSDDDTNKWVSKMKRKDLEKKRAEERAKLLDQMDEEFGISSLVEREVKPMLDKARYSAKDLKGLIVQHDQERFQEGTTTILTLADKGVLDEGDDTLMNLNIQDKEKLEKHLENKSGKPAYRPYDDGEVDEFGMMKPKDILHKYDEEISGAKGESFELGSKGTYNAAHEKRMAEIRAELTSHRQTLEIAAPVVASEFYTQEEINAKFKKRKKKIRKVKKPEMVKADDLLPLDGNVSNARPITEAVFSSEIANTWQDSVSKDNADEDIILTEDLSGIVMDDDVENDYQSSLALQRKKKLKNTGPQIVAQQLTRLNSQKLDEKSVTMDLDALPSEDGGRIELTATDEFCRNLGGMATYGQAGNRLDNVDELMDFENDLITKSGKDMDIDDDEDKRGWEEVEVKEERPTDLDGSVRPSLQTADFLEDEVLLDSGLGAALKFAVGKGYMEANTEKNVGKTLRDTSILAKNYSIEDKRHDDIDDKYRKRGAGGGRGFSSGYSGSTSEVSEKKNYKPNFTLAYTDEKGRELSAKEAFRQLSHKFHGKGSGKKKTEKRMKKLDEQKMMMQMSAIDTPLNTLSRLKEKQEKEKSAFIVLSGGSKTLTGNSMVK